MATYTTQQGDCWYQISLAFYMDSRYFLEIIRANPGLTREQRTAEHLPAGINLVIPDFDNLQTGRKEMLPPWKE